MSNPTRVSMGELRKANCFSPLDPEKAAQVKPRRSQTGCRVSKGHEGRLSKACLDVVESGISETKTG